MEVGPVEQWSMGRETKASVGVPTIGTVECQPQNSFGFSQKGISCKRGWNLSGMGAVRSCFVKHWLFFLRKHGDGKSIPSMSCYAATPADVMGQIQRFEFGGFLFMV